MRTTRVYNITPEFRNDLLPFCGDFHMEARIPGKFNLDVFLANWDRILNAGNGALWRMDHGEEGLGGLLGGIFAPDLCSGEIIAQEAFWYVRLGMRGLVGGVLLYEEFMKWAREIGAKQVLMAYLLTSTPEKLKKFYMNQGFREVEHIFMREVGV